MSKTNKKLSKQTMRIKSQKRLLKDVADIMKDNLSDQGIFYIHDETNFLNGYAMIFGPEKTPYENGIYFFSFKFPYDYPFSPPKLTYLTNDGKTRFNPNLYRNGKVCLSILNTWKGEQWTSCQTIRSILLTLVTVLNENPLINEPGINMKNPQVNVYNKILRYKNFSVAINSVLEQKVLPDTHISFFPIIKNFIGDKKENILTLIRNEIENCENNKLSCSIYNMHSVHIDYKNVLENFQNICCILNI
jgi:ubiquitin-conjugating enzyme E2 Z